MRFRMKQSKTTIELDETNCPRRNIVNIVNGIGLIQ